MTRPILNGVVGIKRVGGGGGGGVGESELRWDWIEGMTIGVLWWRRGRRREGLWK